MAFNVGTSSKDDFNGFLFFLAFLPQFIDPASADKVWSFVGLGLIFSLNGLWVNAAWGLLAAWLSTRLVVVQRSVRVHPGEMIQIEYDVRNKGWQYNEALKTDVGKWRKYGAQVAVGST